MAEHDAETPDAVILADPSSHTIDDVVAVLSRSTPEQVAAAQAVEREGKNRQKIVNFVPAGPPAPEEPPETDEKFPLAGWQERAGWFEVEGDVRVSRHAIAGALADAAPGATFTQAQVQRKLDKFLKIPQSKGSDG